MTMRDFYWVGINSGPEDQGPGTEDPAYERNRRPEDPAVRDTCSLANHCNTALTKQTLPLLRSLGELIEIPSV